MHGSRADEPMIERGLINDELWDIIHSDESARLEAEVETQVRECALRRPMILRFKEFI